MSQIEFSGLRNKLKHTAYKHLVAEEQHFIEHDWMVWLFDGAADDGNDIMDDGQAKHMCACIFALSAI